MLRPSAHPKFKRPDPLQRNDSAAPSRIASLVGRLESRRCIGAPMGSQRSHAIPTKRIVGHVFWKRWSKMSKHVDLGTFPIGRDLAPKPMAMTQDGTLLLYRRRLECTHGACCIFLTTPAQLRDCHHTEPSYTIAYSTTWRARIHETLDCAQATIQPVVSL